MHLLENQRELFDAYVSRLTKSELYSYSNLDLAITLIQKGMLIQKIIEDLRRQTVELGREGTLLKIRLKEIKGGVEKETNLTIKDYTKLDLFKSKFLIENLSYDEILDELNIFGALAYEENTSKTEPIKGWRILTKTSLEESQVAEIIKQFGTIDKIIKADPDEFKDILKPEQIETFKEEIEKINLNA
jgi:DNA integrity scanning protein DisA with diadenylate cyclase activity